MQIATWNVNSLKVRKEHVLNWLKANPNCDVLALQELKQDNESLLSSIEIDFRYLGYVPIFNGQRTYNGVALIVKRQCDIKDVMLDMPCTFGMHNGLSQNLENNIDLNSQKRLVSATIDGIRIMCAYVVNGQAIGSDKYHYKLNWCRAWLDYIQYSHHKDHDMVIVGDFNIAPHDIDVYDPQVFSEQLLCSSAEREIWQQIIDQGFHDGFRLINQQPKQYTWWDYRNFAFRRNLGLRIDHILVSNSLRNNVSDCVIDVGLRKMERPSDHVPVIITIS